MTAAEIIAGCKGISAGQEPDGTWHAACVGADICAAGQTLKDALDKLGILIGVEIRLAVEANQHTITE